MDPSDSETSKWLAEIESFRSPPPPRKLFGSNLVPLVDSRQKTAENLQDQFSKLNFDEKTNGSADFSPKNLNFSKKNSRISPKNDPICSKNGQISSKIDQISPQNQKILVGRQALLAQQDKFEKFEQEIERQLSAEEKKIDCTHSCYECKQPIENSQDATQALNRLYHSQCFVCSQCDQLLQSTEALQMSLWSADTKSDKRSDRDWSSEERSMNEKYKMNMEDHPRFKFSGFQQSMERCAACNHFIMDMILQAAQKSYHPACFRCHKCRCSLDGRPFTMDQQENVYCVDDYHNLFAPRCAKCRKPILPVLGRDETVRVVAMDKDYHVDCYICEFCGLQLTDEQGKCCFPIKDHLLCQNCHFKFCIDDNDSRFTNSPVTDV